MDKLLTICLHQLLGNISIFIEKVSLIILAISSVLLTIGLIRASVYLCKTLACTNLFISKLSKIVILRKIALCGNGKCRNVTVKVIPEPEKKAAFTMGWFKPSIYLTSALVNDADPDSLDIILRHELSHRDRRDPLRNILLNIASELLWFIPVIKPQVENWVLAAEQLADMAAISAGHSSTNVAKVLLGVAEDNLPTSNLAVSSIKNQLELRVKSLLTGHSLKAISINPGLIIASLLIVTSVLLSSAAAISVETDPGGIVSKINQTSSACDNNDHQIDVLAKFGIECPHCGQISSDSISNETPSCHSNL